MLLAQDGHGGGGVVEKGLKDNLLEGVVLSSLHMSPEKLKETSKTLRGTYKDKVFLFDSHFYTSYIPSANNFAKLGLHPYYKKIKKGLKNRSFTPSTIPGFTSDVLAYQMELGLEYIVSPSVIINGFDSASSLISAQLQAEAEKQFKKGKLLHSLPISESSLKDEEGFKVFLNELTLSKASGFYIFVERLESGFPMWSDPNTLAKFMYLVYTLAQSDFEVFCGYVDLVGILLYATGAKGISSGWWQKQRQFTGQQFLKRGGRRPRQKYTSTSLLNSIYLDPDVKILPEIGFEKQVLKGTGYDTELLKDLDSMPWSNQNSRLHYWAVLNKLLLELNQKDSLDKKLKLIKSKIKVASSLYKEMEGKRGKFSQESGASHLSVWKKAITLFSELRSEE